jgi:hypothetical protein
MPINSASRFTKSALVACKLQPTQGTDSIAGSPVAADILKVSNQSVTFNHTMADRGDLRPAFGANGKIFAGSSIDLSYDAELSGSGAAGTAPGADAALKACGLAATINAASNVTYNPISASLQAVTHYFYDSGALHKQLDARGNLDKISFNVGEVPKASFKFSGADGGDTQVAVPSTAPATTWATPLGVCEANSSDVTFGGTYTLATGAIAAGTTYAAAGLELAQGNALQFTALLGQEIGDITGRASTVNVTLDCTAAQEAAFRAQLKANTEQTLIFSHGTTAGNKVQVYVPAAQLTNVSKTDKNGRRLVKLDFDCKQTLGNDDFYLAFL